MNRSHRCDPNWFPPASVLDTGACSRRLVRRDLSIDWDERRSWSSAMTVNGSAWPEMLSTVQQESRLILANVLVIPCDDQDPFEGSVVVEAGRIADILPGTQASLGPGQVIECRGRSLIPGLIDAHVHIGSLDVDIQRQHRTYSTSEAVLRMARLLEATLLQGYTTVRDAGGIDAGFRRAVAHGRGPRPTAACLRSAHLADRWPRRFSLTRGERRSGCSGDTDGDAILHRGRR